ncbi:phosphonate transport system substrate-binding protein [Chitinivorax tropicus]|uniref:Phosphonate transport system substrate-binding protein n=1 Tax=Chitinivorax tropicus TaxID=714531 RepID=A0A840MCN7_9PROT|nr:phosphate/phosphite/phosphonate ABC transporter substrate-binding protein [Chitinivorax tropicus]MBB5017074.1 phosphonate transport system substrate-binding protein [Chitinivorax tropicus]
MRHKGWYVAWLLFWSGLSPAGELTLAVEPFLTPRSLVAAFQPLRDSLSEQINQPVVLVTAKNYEEYLNRLLRGEFDLAIVGPHSGLMVVERAGYIPLLRAAGGLKAVLLVRRDASIQTPRDLVGQTVSFPHAMTITAMLGQELLEQAGLEDVRDLTLRYNEFQNTAAMMLLRKEVAAALVSDLALLPMSDEIKQGVRVLASSKQVPPMVLLANKQLDVETRTRIGQAVIHFEMQEAGRDHFLSRIGINFNHPFTDQDRKALLPYVEKLERQREQR